MKTPKVKDVKVPKGAKLDKADNGKGFKKVGKRGTEGSGKAAGSKWTPPWARGSAESTKGANKKTDKVVKSGK